MSHHDHPISTETREFREGTLLYLKAEPQKPTPQLPRIYLQEKPTLRTPRPNYPQLIADYKSKYKISIRHWRPSMTGIAYELTYASGKIKRLISSPKPKSPTSAAIFLHEVGHHAIGFRRYTLRCLEEHYVWQWTFRELERNHIPLTTSTLRHYHRSMHHYTRQALTQGATIPQELEHFLHPPKLQGNP